MADQAGETIEDTAYRKITSYAEEQQDLIIKLVRERPFLYDASQKDYTYTKIKKAAFDAIGKTCEITGEEAAKKWKYIRDRFLRILKEKDMKPELPEDADNPKWKFYNSLLFLTDHVKYNKRDHSPTWSKSEALEQKRRRRNEQKNRYKKRQKLLKRLASEGRVPEDLPEMQDSSVDDETLLFEPDIVLLQDEAVNYMENSVESAASHEAVETTPPCVAPSTDDGGVSRVTRSKTRSMRNGAAPVPRVTPNAKPSDVQFTDKQNELLKIIKSVGEGLMQKLSSQKSMDAEAAFGVHIVQRLRDMSPRKRKLAQIKIQEALYTAEFDDD